MSESPVSRLSDTARFLEQIAGMGGPLSGNAMEHARRVHEFVSSETGHGEGYPGIAHDLETLRAENERLNALINTPVMDDFLQGVKVEAAHQVERWGEAHDRSKSAEHWYWLVGYLAVPAGRGAVRSYPKA